SNILSEQGQHCLPSWGKEHLAKVYEYNILEETAKSRPILQKIYKKSSFSRKKLDIAKKQAIL
ncbi:MAG: hypothetical protein J6866_04660, partial [Victivallales bacterium]|nr:hypothetical protein [Victivallales bacterium]